MKVITIYTPNTEVKTIDTTDRLDMLHALDREPTAEELSSDDVAAESLRRFCDRNDNFAYIGKGLGFETIDEYLEGAEDEYKETVLNAVTKA